MDYSVNMGYLTKKANIEAVSKALSKAGFKALDYTPPVKDDNWYEVMEHDVNIFSKNGLYVNQTHVPMNRYINLPAKEHIKHMERMLKANEYMNAKYMVVHGDEFDFSKPYSAENALKYNYELCAPIVEAAVAKNINIAFENLFEDGFEGKPRFCSRAEELKALIESFKSENVSCCWDFGHASVAFKERQAEKIAYMDGLISCTHIHDNNQESDLHMPPFLGETDWKACMDALKSKGYNGTFSFEFAHGAIPEEMCKPFFGFLYNTAEYICRL